MKLPRGDEYSMAVQKPEFCFSDSDLKLSTVQTNNLGIPIPYSGGFTTTYKVKSGNFGWAVRCFTREVGHLQKRYQAIDEFIEKTGCDYLIEARYLKHGIQVNNEWSAIIKMHWIEGDLLNVYLGKILNNKEEVEGLLKKFVDLVDNLKKDKIAHGDLQHGNIIVKNDKLFLIDYDGMFLPEIAEVGTEEIGHPSYQHPKRTVGCFNNKLDRFSSLVIYLALKALSLKPSLWKKYNNGENILFKKEDLSDPLNSELFYDLSQIGELKHLTNNLVCVCLSDFAKIPSLNDFVNDKTEFGKITINPPKPKQAENPNDFFGNLYKQKITTGGGFQYKPTHTLQNPVIKNTQTNTVSSGHSMPTSNPVNSSDDFSFKKIVNWVIVIVVIGLVIWGISSMGNSSSTTSPSSNTTNNNTVDTNPTNTECSSGNVRDSAGDCVTQDAFCKDRDGSHSTYNSVSNSCECESGYRMGSISGKCVTPSSSCKEKWAHTYSTGIDSTDTNQCDCIAGYVWNSDSTACIIAPVKTGYQVCADMNATWDGYSLTSSGSYSCTCDTGYVSSSDGKSCVIAPTLTNSQKCARDFSNSYWDGGYGTNGGLTCSCLSGYYWDKNIKGTGCYTYASLSQACSSKYLNTQWDGGYGTNGNYECGCKPGYTWNYAGTACY